MSRRLRIGLIAPEFRPELGGMAVLARGLAEAMARIDEITVYGRAEDREAIDADGFALAPALTGDLRRDRRRLAGEPIDLWLAMNAGCLPLARGLPPPFFVYLHGNDFLEPWVACGPPWIERIRRPYLPRLRHALRRASLRRSLPFARRLLTNSQATAGLIVRELGAPRGRISVCSPGVDDRFFQDHSEAPNGAPLRLLTVCRLTRHSARKNVDGVLRALALASPALRFRYTVVGDGDDRQRLEGLAEELGIDDRVDFLGSVSADELLRCYAASDLFVLASKASARDVEGFGIVYLEASASGVPVLCSREGGSIEAVQPGRNGLILDDSSPETIAAGIRSFVESRDRFYSREVRSVPETYRWPKVAARMREVIEDALSDGEGGSSPTQASER